MKVRLSFPVNEISGKAGGPFGIVLSNWRGVMIARSMVQPANPSTTNQDVVRGNMSNSAIAFQSVTAEEKVLWEAFAEINKSKIMGQEVVRPAIAEYCGVNDIRQLAGEAITDVAPTGKCPYSVTGVSGLATPAGGTNLNLTITFSAAPGAGAYTMVKITAPLPSAVVVPKKSDYRMVETVQNTESIPALVATPGLPEFDETWVTLAEDDYIGISLTPLSAEFVKGVEYATVIQLGPIV